MTGSLTVVGTGMTVAGQLTLEARACIERAEKLFFLVPDPVTSSWIRSLNRTAESLLDCYRKGRPRLETYGEMVDRILAPVQDGRRVCAAFYGHPGFFVNPSHEAIRRTRAQGLEARMLPGISSLDCLFADLGIDPGVDGCQIFEATDFLMHRRRFDPRNKLILLQITSVGVRTWEQEKIWSPEGLQLLVDELTEVYPRDHEVVAYEVDPFPVCETRIQRVPLGEIPGCEVSANSTLYVPPFGKAAVDPEMMRRLGLPLPE